MPSTDDEPAPVVAPTASSDAPKPSAGKMSFGAAFRAARNAGDKVFTWRGKSYNTKLASSPAPKPSRTASPSSPPAKPSNPTASDIASGWKGYMDAVNQRKAGQNDAARTRLRSALSNPQGLTDSADDDDSDAAVLARLKAAADAPGASGYAKSRYKYAAETGMLGNAKGGRVKKADGPAKGSARTKKFAKGGMPNFAKPKTTPAKVVRASAPGSKPKASFARSPTRQTLDALRNNMDTGAGIKTPPQFKKGGKMLKEGSPAEMARDRKQAKKAGVSMKNFEGSPADKDDVGGKMKKMAKGGGIESKGKTKGKMVKMAKGGSISSRADGVASKGKTKGKMVGMACGGMMRKGR